MVLIGIKCFLELGSRPLECLASSSLVHPHFEDACFKALSEMLDSGPIVNPLAQRESHKMRFGVIVEKSEWQIEAESTYCDRHWTVSNLRLSLEVMR